MLLGVKQTLMVPVTETYKAVELTQLTTSVLLIFNIQNLLNTLNMLPDVLYLPMVKISARYF